MSTPSRPSQARARTPGASQGVAGWGLLSAPAAPPARPLPARGPSRSRRFTLIALACAAMLALLLAGAVSARAAGGEPVGWWHLDATPAPTLLPSESEGRPGEAQVVMSATNLGDAPIDASGEHVTLTDTLPAAITPLATSTKGFGHASEIQCQIHAQRVVCEFDGTLAPYEPITVRVTLHVGAPSPVGLVNTVEVAGGHVPAPQALRKPLRLAASAAEETPFGVETFEMVPENADGSRDTLAGSHPFQLTTTVDFNQTLHYEGAQQEVLPAAPALPRNLKFTLPAGLIGSATAVPQCSDTDFAAAVTLRVDLCPSDSVVGVATVFVDEPDTFGLTQVPVPIFSLEPSVGEPARFGFDVFSVPVVLRTSIPAGGEYPVQVSVTNASQLAQVLATQVTFWGVPGDPRHDSARGWDCVAGDSHDHELGQTCTPQDDQQPLALLSLPTSCQDAPVASMSGESWSAGNALPAVQLAPENTEYRFPSALSGCEGLEFNPSFTTQLETPFASTPTGVGGTLTFPQQGLTEAEGRAESALSDATVILPEGVQVNPGAANGLSACTEEEIGYTGQNPQSAIFELSPGAPHCPESSKLATLHARTPLLEEELTGAIYVAEPAPNGEPGKNPFNTLVAGYLVLQAPKSGILIKLPAYIHLDEGTGVLEGVFPHSPQLPFHELTISFFGGERGGVSSPPFCGSYQNAGQLTGWSGATADPLSQPPFLITAGPEGSACPEGHLPFAPSFKAGPTSPQAGAFSPIIVDIGRPDGQQAVSGLSVTEPPGFAAVLASVTPCPEPPAGQEWACDESSHIGEVKTQSGLGSEPVRLTGQAYLTSGYDGAPFGLLVRTLAQVGPFNLGWVNVRSRINVNPNTAQVTVTSDPGPRGEGIPTMLKGVPVQLKALEVAINRPDFTFNPTSCNPMEVTATLDGSEGAAFGVSAPFKAEGCAALPFHPALEASTEGHASKAGGASLTVKVTSQGLGVANIQKVFLTIPKILPSRLQPTLQHACLAAVFESNPAGCDEDSLIGHATVRTPILKSPLTGPAYVVSHGGAAFPDVEFVLQGEGITLILDGKTQIKGGVTYSRFESAPDAPFTSFETLLPTGPHSILAVNTEEAPDYELCTHAITIPTTITAQDGATLEQTTKVAVTGCSAARLTKAQLLAKALKACRKDKRKASRLACEKAARRRYAAHSSKKTNAEKARHAKRRR
jgi:hypothetical protein